MSNPTTPFSWQMPTATDLVTDLPADFEVFGQAVATSMADLLGGTTGQVLSKTTNADMDFTWINNDQGDITGVTAGTGISGGGTSGTVTVTNSMATAIDAKGDLIGGTGADTFARLAVGANGTILTADSAEATGMKWAAPAGGGKILQVIQATYSTETTIATTTFTDTGLSATITPSSTSSRILVLVQQMNSRSRSGTGVGSGINLLRGATAIYSSASKVTAGYMSASISGGSINAVNLMTMTPLHYLDSPATTSATTYKTQIAAQDTSASGQAVAQTENNTSTIILMEVGP